MPEAAGLHYEVHGEAVSPPLILSSGLGGAAHYWAPNIPALAAHFRVIAYDHRGTGRSEPNPPGPTSIEAMADDVLALMNALRIEQSAFMGHALGGMIGLALAMKAPARLSRIAVINGWAQLDPYTARCFDVRLALLRDSGPEAYLKAQPIFLFPPAWISAHHQQLETEAIDALAHFPGRATVEKRIAAVRAWHPGPALTRVNAPVLAYASADDALVPSKAAKALCALLPDARRILQPSGGHACNVTEPDAFHERILPWLLGERQEI